MTTRHKDMIAELLDHDPDADGREMSAWELQFVESLDKRDHRLALTEAQIRKLEEVWERIFG